MKRALAVCIILVCVAPQWVSAQTDDETAADRVNAVTQRLAQKQKHRLQYKFKKDDELRWKVEHTASTKTQIAGTLEETSSRSQSTKFWKVVNVDSRGTMRFVHSIEEVEMWQQIGDGAPVSYKTSSDKEPPSEFAGIREKVGKPLAMISISPTGEVVDHKTTSKQTKFGVGDICIPLPAGAVSIGHSWNVPTQFSGTDENGKKHILKARLKYTLTKVKGKYAYISFRTEVLTPVENAKVRSQILQKLTNGYAVFDIPGGKLVRKEVEWNEKVQGYEGADSFLQYIGRLSEKFVMDSSSAKSAPTTASAPVKIKERDGKPIMRK